MESLTKTILLNSHSPRRKQILEQMGLEVEVVSSLCQETFSNNLLPEQVALYLATKKSEAYKGEIQQDQILLSADTIVVLDNQILGKPKDETKAKEMLKSLSNREHKVITGCYMKSKNKGVGFFETTQVLFDSLTDEEIDYYVSTKRPLDKAGSYGIQEWIGMIGIKAIKGDYYNVMGLPSNRVWQEIKNKLW